MLDVTAAGNATGGTLPHHHPSKPIILSGWHLQGSTTMPAPVSQCTYRGFQRAQLSPGVLCFHCVRQLKPVMMEGGWKGDRLRREHRGCDNICTQVAPAFGQTRGKKQMKLKYSCTSGSSSHLTFLPRAGCAAGDKCKDFTWLSMQPSS